MNMPFIKYTLPLAAILCISLLSSCTNNDNETQTYKYCVYFDDTLCTEGSFATCQGNGVLSNNCPYVSSFSSSDISSSSVELSSSSSVVVSGSCDISFYRTVKIGEQTWMAENFNCNVRGSKCYGSDPDNCDKYGRLYNWITAMALPYNCNSSFCSSQIGPKHRGICPSGWHIPSDADWNILMKFVNPSCSDNKNCAGAGTKLKATIDWDDNDNGNGNGQDTYGFSALPGGDDGYLQNLGIKGYWWSASEDDEYNNIAYIRVMSNDDEDVRYEYTGKTFSYSVRCVQD
ncbi:MAG: hypothetical protein LBC75_01780 [Fibromonadaceae bacterium]|jgi:uncharacterized protein (TIGR02145 family)|nr:hypothetical protein [Fibromonadaceae bacterium]